MDLESLKDLADRGSFRDPAGCVFRINEQIYRYIPEDKAPGIGNMLQSPWFRNLVTSGMVIPSAVVDPDESKHLDNILGEIGGKVLRHEKVPFVSYPYEWSTKMCVDAGLLTLNIQENLLGAGHSLKDATPYNVQFVGCRPVFVDVCSIEPCSETGIWNAYDQFCRFWIYPLLLHRLGLRDFRLFYLSRIDGLSIDTVRELAGLWPGLRFGIFLDYFLPVLLGGLKKVARAETKSAMLKRRRHSREIQLMTVRRCRKILRKLGKVRANSQWSAYIQENNYSSEVDAQKFQFVENVISSQDIKDLADLGCNTGQYSILAARRGIRVVAVDSDLACIERLYGFARNERLDILPLCVDIANPSPAIGWGNEERAGLLSRLERQFDCVLSLALVHHLLVTHSVPLEFVAELQERWTKKLLIAEFVAPRDSRFREMVRYRSDGFDYYTVDYFKKVYSKYFRIVKERRLLDESRQLDRTLFLMERYAG